MGLPALSGGLMCFTKSLVKNCVKRGCLTVFSSGKKPCRSFKSAGVIKIADKNSAACQHFSTNSQLEFLEESALSKKWLPEDELFALVEGFTPNKYSPTCLYPESEDPLLLAFLKADSTEQIFSLCREHKHLNHKQASQALVTLWDLHYLYCQSLGKTKACIQSNLLAYEVQEFIQVIFVYLNYK